MKQRTLTCSHCGGCDGILLTPSSSDSGSDSDGVLSSHLQTSQCVHCQSPINSGGIRVSETAGASIGVRDGV